MVKYFKPGPGRFGAHPAFTSGALQGALTANGTTTIGIATPYRKCAIEAAALSAVTGPVDADGTFIATLKKKDNVANAVVTLSAGLDIEAAGLVSQKAVQFTLLTTLTENQKTLRAGDTLYVEIVNNSAAIDTQPVYLAATVELLVLN